MNITRVHAGNKSNTQISSRYSTSSQKLVMFNLIACLGKFIKQVGKYAALAIHL